MENIKSNEFNNGIIYQGDCLEVMKRIEDKSVDAIICDLPYGTTACKWDNVIPFEPLWEQYNRIIKDNGAIVLFGSQPFTSALVMSNPKMFKYEWIWEKAVGSNFTVVKYQPMKEHENILVFGKNKVNYYPIMQERKGSGNQRIKYKRTSCIGGNVYNNIIDNRCIDPSEYKKLRNPSSVQFFNNRENTRGLHPTQKPIALLEYLINTYTNEGETILDNCMGSGSTCVACQNINRKFIGIELDENYYNIALKRIKENE